MSKNGWFGENWGAPVCHDEDHVETPTGKPCIHCKEIFVDGDQGLTNYQNQSWHLDCYLRGIYGGVNHIRGSCTCCDGTDDPDPPNVSKREAARLAVIEKRKLNGIPRT